MLPVVAIKMRSVSAASSAFAAQIAKQFKRVADTLTIG
jgi:hypothetical protein